MRLTFLFIFLTLSAFAQPAPRYVMSAPAGSEYTKIDKAGRTVLPNGRFITPRGRQIQTAPHPYGLVLSPDGKTVITANSGINPFSISIIRDVLGGNPVVQQIPEGPKTDNGILEACFMGLAVSPDSKTVYVAGGETNKIFAFDLATGKPTGTINCSVKNATTDFSHGYIGDMALTRDGKTLYALDQIGFRMMVIDVATKTIRHNVPTGRYPFGITLSPDERTAYVANVGVFEYMPFTDLDRKDLKRTAHEYPASKYGSKEMRDGDAAKGIPALGDPNSPDAFSVWSISLTGTPASDRSAGAAPTVTAKIKTGFLVGQMVEDFPAVGGSSPNSVVATDQYVFVSNGNNDCVSVIDVKTNAVVKNIALSPDARLGNLRGVIPFGLALSPDSKRLFVAEAGINAVAVVDVPTLTVIGHIPTGWFPSKLKVSADNKKLVVANAKGYGSGPNGGRNYKLGAQGSYIGSLMNGTVSVMDIPSDADLKAETEQVIRNNFVIRPVTDVPQTSNPIPAFAGQRDSPNGGSPIKHIVFIAKENRTYDEVFGQMTNGDGDSTLARYGTGVTVKHKRGNQTVERANVMPNHLALARRFAMSDNFYCDSDVSADGHRWLVNTYPNEWVETGTAAAYGGKRNLRDTSNAPGNLSFYGSAGSIYPEDYNEGGSMWEHLERWEKDFFNFGFGVEMAGAYSDSTMKYIGEKYTINYPLPAPLFDRTSRTFPTYNMAIPDQFRADVFMKEFNEKWLPPPPSIKGGPGQRSGRGGVLPAVITLMLPNDHGSTPRPKAGFPFTESYMADNDLALGRVVEFLSQTPYWKNMAIFVVEDDPQGGVDHIDAHRSPLLVISPYVKRNHVGHVHYSFGSVFKTFWNILGIPCLNQYDAGATDLSDLFTDQPDFTPYRALPADVRLFDPQKALDPFDEKFDWKAFSQSEELDRTETMQKRRAEEDKQQRDKTSKPRKTKRSR